LLQVDPTFKDFAARVQSNHRFGHEQVRVATLDSINSYTPPYVVKLDVEGGERIVLEGAQETLRQTDFLLIEISVMRRMTGELTFSEMIGYLENCGFELFDIPSLSQTNGTPQLIYLDAAFVPKGSSLWPS
jgi:hypothetical protein